MGFNSLGKGDEKNSNRTYHFVKNFALFPFFSFVMTFLSTRQLLKLSYKNALLLTETVGSNLATNYTRENKILLKSLNQSAENHFAKMLN